MKTGSMLLYLMILIITFGCDKKQEETNNNQITEKEIDTAVIISGLDTPWEILWGPDGYIWMTEREGIVSRVNAENGEKQELINIPVEQTGESGLLGMALHPDFSTQPYVYLVYTYNSLGSIKERLSRFTYQQDKLVNEEVLIDNITGNNYHDGSRLLFGSDGKLYMTTGEAGNQPLAQDINSLNGKILRINADGSIPADNPNSGSYVWALGSRNAQGLDFGPGGILYESEHGPETDDEINIIEKGRNYGWPEVAGYCDKNDEKEFCESKNVKVPIEAYTPTLALAGIAYYGSDLIPQWKNSLIVTSLKAGRLLMLHLSKDGKTVEKTTTFYNGTLGRLRDVCVSDDGRIFVSTSNKDGRGTPQSGDDKIIVIKPASR